MPDCARFYALRNLRTVECVGDLPFDALPVHVAISDACAATPAGQLALLALANQLSRVHRRVTFDLPSPSLPLFAGSPFFSRTVGEALLSTVTQIDPCGDFSIGPPPTGRVVSVGLGDDVGAGFDWYIGADRAVAKLTKAATGFSPVQSTLLGAALASCLGAAAVFRSVVGLGAMPRRLSCWNYAEGIDASPGPERWWPLDVGRVLMVGAGAVAASLVFWLSCFGVEGDWTIIDSDAVALHNTNRGLVFTAADAGWPDGPPRRKAELLAASVPGARWDAEWYDESRFARERYDVILGLANDRDVRHQLACRNSTVTLHATTGKNWLSQLHRHITGLDDCIWCRAGEAAEPVFQCSKGAVELAGGTKTDASLPFLSAASGLMLATALQRLQMGELATLDRNDWRWDFASPHRMTSSSFRTCREDCSRISPAKVRKEINRGSRWRELDSEVVRLGRKV